MSIAAEMAKFSSHRENAASQKGPILILTINNGSAHTRAAQALANAWQSIDSKRSAKVIEVSDFMSRKARFSHVTAYLWLIKNAPSLWGKIDAYQKRQAHTSPAWYYRRECRKLFQFVQDTMPAAIVSTEVGCGEIAALIKKDMLLDIPLIAVSLDYDADCAWVQPETDLYCVATSGVRDEFVRLGVDSDKIRVWGVPMDSRFRFFTDQERQIERKDTCLWLGLDPQKPVILVAGGGEGMGEIEGVVNCLLHRPVQIVVLTGHNEKLKKTCEKIGFSNRVKVLGWTDRIASLMHSADILVSKLGLTFYEAMACGLPLIATMPPPGSERIQYELLEKFGTGRAVRSVGNVADAVSEMLGDPGLLQRMRKRAEAFGQTRAADKIVRWLQPRI